MMRCRATLRWLVTFEILLALFVVSVSFLQTPFLPATLQQFESEPSDSFGIADILCLCFGILLIIAAIISWVALLGGWRRGRMLYTATWVACAPFMLVAGPSVQSALLSTVDTAASLAGGVILGYLYFSDIRHFYEQPGNPS